MSPEQAANLLRDEYFLSEIEKLRQQQIEVILNSAPGEFDRREDAYRMIKCLADVVAHFRSIVDTVEMRKRRWKIL